MNWKDNIRELLDNDRRLWAYTTSLRGCDVKDFPEILKVLFTCPLRGECSKAYGFEELRKILENLNVNKVYDTISRTEIPPHYVIHLIEGWDSLGYYNIGPMVTNILLHNDFSELINYIVFLEEWVKK